MGSGLDDYPRTDKSHQISTQHVDLLSWLYLFSESLTDIANYLNLKKPALYYSQKKLVMR
jgi:hypothetical protein